jgi:hypothetical protein
MYVDARRLQLAGVSGIIILAPICQEQASPSSPGGRPLRGAHGHWPD